MDVSSVKGWIQQNQIPDFLIFSGPEWAIQKIYIDKIAQVTKLQMKYMEGITDFYGSLRSRQFISKKSLYIVRDDKDILTNEELQNQLSSGLLGENKLILLLTNVDKRTKFYKHYKDQIIDFEPLKPNILKKYIQKEINLSDENCEELMEVCEYDYGRCLFEIDKIKCYIWQIEEKSSDKSRYDKAFESLLKDGSIYKPPKDAIFDLIDAILDRKVNKSFDLMTQSYAVGEATMVMLSVLYTNVKALLQVQSCNGSDIAKITGLSGWQITNAKKHLGVYKTGELVHMMRMVRECEKGIKTGQIEEQFAMDYIIVNCM